MSPQQQERPAAQPQPAASPASEELTDRQLDAVAGGMIIYGSQLASPTVNVRAAGIGSETQSR